MNNIFEKVSKTQITCVPPPLLTMKFADWFSVCITAPWRLMVPRHVWAISAWFLSSDRSIFISSSLEMFSEIE